MLGISKQKGVTLIELMVVVAIAAIVLTLAVPAMNTMRLNSLADEVPNALLLDLTFARNQAVTRPDTVSVISKDGDWKNGWRIQDSANQVIRSRGGFDSEVSITSNTASIVFLNSGRVQNTASITTKVANCVGNRNRTISFSSIGQVLVAEVACE